MRFFDIETLFSKKTPIFACSFHNPFRDLILVEDLILVKIQL